MEGYYGGGIEWMQEDSKGQHLYLYIAFQFHRYIDSPANFSLDPRRNSFENPTVILFVEY